MCRSVHAEANAIIHASREKMLRSTLYLVGKEATTEEYVENASPCSMCKRMIINSGIDQVIIRRNNSKFDIVPVTYWIEHDESLENKPGY
jgi:dCMP deaminase